MLAAGLVVAGGATAQGGEPHDLLTITNDALQYSAAYEAARAQYVAARELIPQAQGKLLPQLTAQGKYDYFWEDISGTFFNVPVDRSAHYNQATYGAQLTQALYRPELLLGKASAQARLEQAGQRLRAQQDALLFSAAQAYFGVIATQEAAALARTEVETLAQHLRQTRERVDAGLSIEAELKTVEASYQLARANLTRADDAVLDAQITLEALTGQHYSRLQALPETVQLVAPQPSDVAQWLARAKIENPLIRGKQAALEMAITQRKIAGKAQLPKVDLIGNAYWLDSSGGATGDRDENQQRIGVMATVPLYAGGQIEATKRQTFAQQQQAESELQDTVRQVERDVRIAHRKATSGLQQVSALQQAVIAAQSAESAARAAFDAGTLTSADMLEAVRKRFEAERSYSQARYAALLSGLQLKVLAGNLLVADVAQVNQLLSGGAR